jgi:predicted ABC-type exoprotein transport system permease subunit
MFSRIRHASQVLSSSSPKNLSEEPDIIFEEQASEEVSTVSRRIGVFIELFVLTIVVGFVGAPLFARHLPIHADATTTTALVAVILTYVGHQMWNTVNEKIREHLKIGERIAPFFGHKIVRAMKTLRG